jgi:hypothetical protein
MTDSRPGLSRNIGDLRKYSKGLQKGRHRHTGRQEEERRIERTNDGKYRRSWLVGGGKLFTLSPFAQHNQGHIELFSLGVQIGRLSRSPTWKRVWLLSDVRRFQVIKDNVFALGAYQTLRRLQSYALLKKENRLLFWQTTVLQTASLSPAWQYIARKRPFPHGVTRYWAVISSHDPSVLPNSKPEK